MKKIYFICGFIGSGKTTFSMKLAKEENAFRFSIDEWMIPLFGEHMEREVFDQRIDTLTELFKNAALDMMNLGVSVIFDFGFWTRSDRESISQWACSNSIEYEFIYLDTPYELCCQRALQRNECREDKSYEMTPEMLDMFWSWFEIPEDIERVNTIIKP